MPVEFSQRIKNIPVYPVAEGYAQSEPLVKLASNESPYPPIPAVVEAAQRALADLNRYPDPSNARLREALGNRFGFPSDRIAIGNGSCDILLALGEALLEPGAEFIYGWPSFSVYPHIEAASGARAIKVPLDSNDRFNLDAIAQEITVATRLVIICNPNNPTGTALPLTDIEPFLAEVPSSVCVLIDEAYCEYSTLDDPDESIELLKKYPNLVLLRTFSKIYGLAGLRVGYALCGTTAIRTAVDQVRQPFFCNAAAQAAAIESLRHQDVVARRLEHAVIARVTLAQGLEELGIEPARSEANFVWFSVGDREEEERIVSGLSERGVIVRAGTALGREGCMRVTYGTSEENEQFLAELKALLS